MSILILAGSIRSKPKNVARISQVAASSDDLEGYLEEIRGIQTSEEILFSNCEILCGVAMIGVQELKMDVKIYPLIELFKKKEHQIDVTEHQKDTESLEHIDTLSLDQAHLNQLIADVGAAKGIILVSPIYFGDRSSVANKFLQLSGIHNLLEGKVFGSVSVGAKRNGGQETAVIYSLLEALKQGALAVGNGPSTSQYGGTAWAGNLGTVIDDEFGTVTTLGVGRRVANVSQIISAGKKAVQSKTEKAKILILVAIDDAQQTLLSYVEECLSKVNPNKEAVEIEIVNLVEKTIFRCIGCSTCPADGRSPVGETLSVDNHRHCIIKNPEDCMDEIHKKLITADGILVAGLNVKDHKELLYRYQAFTERTRFIRRNHFELNNKLLSSLSLNQVGATVNDLHSVKTVTSYIRHNTIIHKPIEAFQHNGVMIEDGLADLKHFIEETHTVKQGKKQIQANSTEYVEKGIGGY